MHVPALSHPSCGNSYCWLSVSRVMAKREDLNVDVLPCCGPAPDLMGMISPKLIQKMMQRCRHQQVLIYTSVVHKILSTTPLNTLRCPDVAICTDLTISTVGKCDTISVSIQNLTMVTEGKKTLFIVPVKAILK